MTMHFATANDSFRQGGLLVALMQGNVLSTRPLVDADNNYTRGIEVTFEFLGGHYTAELVTVSITRIEEQQP